MQELGFELIKNKFINAVEEKIKVDGTLKLCFGSQYHQANEQQVIENINCNIETIHRNSSKLLSTDKKWQSL